MKTNKANELIESLELLAGREGLPLMRFDAYIIEQAINYIIEHERENKMDRLDNVKVVLDEGAYMPQKAHEYDAGFDLFTPIGFTVRARSSYSVRLGVHIAIPEGYCGFIKSKSGLYVKHDLTCEGVVDSGFTGSIVVKVTNHGEEDYHFEKGNKLTQMVILPTPVVNLVMSDTLDATERGDSGFGSTGV